MSRGATICGLSLCTGRLVTFCCPLHCLMSVACTCTFAMLQGNRVFFDSADYALALQSGSKEAGSATSNHGTSPNGGHVVYWQSLVQQAEANTPVNTHVLAVPHRLGAQFGSPCCHPQACTPGTQPLHRGARRASRLSECSMP